MFAQNDGVLQTREIILDARRHKASLPSLEDRAIAQGSEAMMRDTNGAGAIPRKSTIAPRIDSETRCRRSSLIVETLVESSSTRSTSLRAGSTKITFST